LTLRNMPTKERNEERDKLWLGRKKDCSKEGELCDFTLKREPHLGGGKRSAEERKTLFARVRQKDENGKKGVEGGKKALKIILEKGREETGKGGSD